MNVSTKLLARVALPAAAALFATLPAAAFQAGEARDPNGGSGGMFSAPEIEIAAVSSALLVAAGAALILRDRKARRQNDKPE
jgi:hypothetical protein